MTTYEIYTQAIKPLTSDERLHIARLILDDLALDAVPTLQSGFGHLKQILPQIERISFTDQDLAGVVLDSAKP